MKQQVRLERFARGMWEWFSRHKRTLPWRDLEVDDENQKAYMVLVSEVMLQQTQVSRVTVIFRRFLQRFPTVAALAAASNKDVIIAWKGMGYNSRALRLRDAARIIHDQFTYAFPSSLERLLSIKGIGNYTAAAIRNFAFNLPTPCVDTNIERIMQRVFIGPEPDKLTTAQKKNIKEYASKSLRIALDGSSVSSKRSRVLPKPRGEGGSCAVGVPSTSDWHAALMDFGSLVCTKRSPRCDLCIFSEDGICKSAYRVRKNLHKKIVQKEPGRIVGSTFVPNRIVRGRVVDLLRDAHRGLGFEEIGESVYFDWSGNSHREWLGDILASLEKNEIVTRRNEVYVLRD